MQTNQFIFLVFVINNFESQVKIYSNTIQTNSHSTVIKFNIQEGPKSPRLEWSHLLRTTNVVHQILVEDL